MPEKVTISDDQRYINIVSTGEVDFEHFRAALDEALALHEKHGTKLVLVDSRGREELPSSYDMSAGAHLLAERTRSKLRFAILVDRLADAHDEFTTEVGLDFGLVRFFTEENEALAWLGVEADED